MNLYRETPKTTIYSTLRRNFTPDDLDLIREDINTLMMRCNTLDQLVAKATQVLKQKKAHKDTIRKSM